MKKNNVSLKWRVKIDGKEYGDNIKAVNLNTNSEIAEYIEVVATQMKYTIQKIITGKDETDVLYEEKVLEFNKLGD